MKNRPYSVFVILASLAACCIEIALDYRIHAASVPDGIPMDVKPYGPVWSAFLSAFLPYAIVCSLTAWVAIPREANWLLCLTVSVMAWIGYAAWMDVLTRGSCMRGFGRLAGYVEQIGVALAAVVLALIARATVVYRQKRLTDSCHTRRDV